jgi:hypothetical protein
LDEFISRIRTDRRSKIELRRNLRIVGHIYTELDDIEYEYSGYALYDRIPKNFGYDVTVVNCPDFLVLDYFQSTQLVTIPFSRLDIQRPIQLWV